MGVVVLDTNVLLLLTVGSASRDYIAKHKRLKCYTVEDFDRLCEVISKFSELIFLPHILAETSNLARYMSGFDGAKIQAKFKILIEATREVYLPSSLGVQREEYEELGLTDALIMHLCSLQQTGLDATLLTSDHQLANRAHSLGYSVIDFKRDILKRD